MRLLLFFWLCIGSGGGLAIAQYADTAQVNKKKLTRIILAESAFYVAGMSYLQFIWYKDHEAVPFHFYDDHKGYLQIDKFGHVFGSYLESYAGYHLLRDAGVSRKKSLMYGGALGFVLQAPIEVFDGLYEGWGFSWSDVVANATGSALVVGQELLFREQLVKYKFSFWRSPYAAQANGYMGRNFLQSLFLDYNGHTYWLSAPLNKLVWHETLPPWLSVAAGYSANGMFGEFENLRYYRGVWLPETARYRQFLLSLDVDWTRIPTRSRFLKKVFNVLFFVKVPFPALEVNTQGQLKGYWLYF
ncbi:Uncharacterized conserved protein YfiM, DUF2279 family [Catalinimonas alkaloidigena]|uniref:Uncharacterized conserved protein YfiM, DUF2279 family n=1 Tax=Catalinimonas alkaloidigena TaxID=1075417 RepID=A0A1G9EPG6_9BACT|nr:DUF2279 domain-containing protein [Catalinimonas alkaloidigena]SDK78019.1 Uncharacterized conserved protein YfiM, DUF2279 family [Catalinimonas alkaloidigena]